MTFATIFLTKCYKQCFDINMYIKTFHTLNTLVFFLYIAYITLPCRLFSSGRCPLAMLKRVTIKWLRPILYIFEIVPGTPKTWAGLFHFNFTQALTASN